MDQQSGKPDDLPGNEDKEFWGDADWGHIDMRGRGSSCGHYFVMKTGREVGCQKGCGTGYIISPKETVRDGHIYRGELMLI